MKIVEKEQPHSFDPTLVKLGDIIKMRVSNGFANYLVITQNSKYACVRLDDKAGYTPFTLTQTHETIPKMIEKSFGMALQNNDLILKKDAELHV